MKQRDLFRICLSGCFSLCKEASATDSFQGSSVRDAHLFSERTQVSVCLAAETDEPPFFPLFLNGRGNYQEIFQSSPQAPPLSPEIITTPEMQFKAFMYLAAASGRVQFHSMATGGSSLEICTQKQEEFHSLPHSQGPHLVNTTYKHINIPRPLFLNASTH